METTAREFNQKSSQILAAAERGETITVTKNGRPVATITPYREAEIPPYPIGPIGDSIDIPELDLGGDLTNDEMEEILKGMGS
ncbi:type II toxin-antitoxin system prevent-host-death family antitoxin [Streptomyces sp. Je 1-332]|uniref:type II toxin-antitoxin system Phd/YefM family antitoxin n=1 Tax=Streptomyces sp. Je 1-332 TaxID=3231270 RepID=UPI003459689F